MKDAEGELVKVLKRFGCETGTLHGAKAGSGVLNLVCAVGVPEFLIEKVEVIPFGKGIAGVAAESKGAVELCNLQEDLGGVAKVGARKSGVAGSLAVPIFCVDGVEVVGVLGIGKVVPYEFSDEEKSSLGAEGERMREFL